MLALCLLLTIVAAAEEPQVPALLQQQPDFYGAIAGGELSVTGTLTPKQVSIDGEFLLTLVVDQVRNPSAIRRPPLSTMPGYSRQFQISDLDEKTSDKRIEFRYRLRPRIAGKLTLPSLAFAYFNPARPSGNLPSKMVDFPTITVHPASTPSIQAATEARYPNAFFSKIPVPPASRAVPRWEWATLGLFPLMGFVGVLVARWWHPEGVQVARIRKIRSVRHALNALARLHGNPDPVNELSSHFLRYLRERHGVVAKQPLPTLVREELEQHGLFQMASEAESLFVRFDQARFSPFPDEAPSLIEQTHKLILRWEGIA